MHLSDADLRDLAAFLARRMTTDFAPVTPTDTSIPDTSTADAWLAVLVEARDGGWLPSLVSRITEARPNDATLREAASLLVSPKPSTELRLAGLLLATGIMGMGGLAATGVVTAGLLVAFEALQETPSETMNTNADNLAFLADSEQSADLLVDTPAPPEPPSTISAARPAEGLSLAGDGLHAAVDLDAAPADQDGDPDAVSADFRGEDGPPESVSRPGVVTSVLRGGPHFSSEKCGGHPGEAVGYWYAGRRSPGPPRTRVVLDRMINVRDEYPHRGNHWNARTRIRCVLEPGDVATISVDPLVIEGGHVWVPVLAGDIRAPESDGTADASAADDLSTP